MVQGQYNLQRRFDMVPRIVRGELIDAMEKSARRIVADMRVLNPLPGVIEVGWTWGAAPRGTVLKRTFRGHDYGTLAITIYATAYTKEYPKGGPGFPAVANWFEFGTNVRTQRQVLWGGRVVYRNVGRITEQPYFWPAYNANRTRVKGALSRAVTRGFKKANRR